MTTCKHIEHIRLVANSKIGEYEHKMSSVQKLTLILSVEKTIKKYIHTVWLNISMFKNKITSLPFLIYLKYNKTVHDVETNSQTNLREDS